MNDAAKSAQDILQLEERALAAETRAEALRKEVYELEVEARRLRLLITTTREEERLAALEELNVHKMTVYNTSLGVELGQVDIIMSEWAVMGVGSRKRLVGVGRNGNLLAVYELQDTTRLRGSKKLVQKYGGPVPTYVDLELSRRFT